MIFCFRLKQGNISEDTHWIQRNSHCFRQLFSWCTIDIYDTLFLKKNCNFWYFKQQRYSRRKAGFVSAQMFRHHMHIEVHRSCDVCNRSAFTANPHASSFSGVFGTNKKSWRSGAGHPKLVTRINYAVLLWMVECCRFWYMNVCASIYQADQSFSIESRGKQCAMMSFSALLALICEQFLPIQRRMTRPGVGTPGKIMTGEGGP